MDKIIIPDSFKEIENLYSDLQNDNALFEDNKAFFEELKNKLEEYEKTFPIFIKSLYAKYLLNCKEYSHASHEIKEAISCLESNSDNISRLFLNHTDSLNDIYSLAGEIYAYNNEEQESRKAFQTSLLYSTEIKSLEDVTTVLSFRNFNQFTLSDLINNELTLCSPKLMNDPYDTLFLKWGEYQNNKAENKKHIKYLSDAFNYYRIRSFSLPIDNNNNKMIENILMWSHYAGNHEGFCIEYKLSKETFNITKDEYVVRLKKIIYRDDDNNNKDNNNNKETPIINLETNTISTNLGLCRKHPLWEYENEVRLIAYVPGNEKNYYQIPLGNSTIESVYFGYKCSEEHIKTIMNILSDKIPYYKMESDYSNIYKLKAKKYIP